MASIDLSPVPLGIPGMFLLMSSPHVMGLSYHRWLHLVAALFLVLCALNAGIQLEPRRKNLSEKLLMITVYRMKRSDA